MRRNVLDTTSRPAPDRGGDRRARQQRRRTGALVIIVPVLAAVALGAWAGTDWLTAGRASRSAGTPGGAAQVLLGICLIVAAATLLLGGVLVAGWYHGRTGAGFSARLAGAVELLHDRDPSVGTTGVAALEVLACESGTTVHRQECIDELCSILRGTRLAGAREGSVSLAAQDPDDVGTAVVAAIRRHLSCDDTSSWDGCTFDLTGCTLTDADFRGIELAESTLCLRRAQLRGSARFDRARIDGGAVCLDDARISSGTVSFDHAVVSAGGISLTRAAVTGATISLCGVAVSGGAVSLDRTRLDHAAVLLEGAGLSGGTVTVDGAHLDTGKVSLDRAQIDDTVVSLGDVQLNGGAISFRGARVRGGSTLFRWARMLDGRIDFTDAELAGGEISFRGARFDRGTLDFTGAAFRGSRVSFDRARFGQAVLDLRHPTVWSRPPRLTGPPPAHLLPPTDGDRRRTSARADGAH